MVTSYLLNLKYFKLNSLNMDYNTITEDITRLTDDLNTAGSVHGQSGGGWAELLSELDMFSLKWSRLNLF